MKIERNINNLGALIAILAASTSTGWAATLFDANVTPDVIFGSGNLNGGFTVTNIIRPPLSVPSIELGLRAKLRFNALNQPENTFNSNGDGTYDFPAGQPAGGGFGFAPGSSSTAIWNFEWSINTDILDASDTPGGVLSDYTYELGIDFDPSAGTDFYTFDPINQPVADHALGFNSTGNGAGTVNATPTYPASISQFNVAQNSWNMEFFDGPAGKTFDANVPGEYDIYLRILENGTSIGETAIKVRSTSSVPDTGSSLILLSSAVLGLGGIHRRFFSRS